MLHARHHFLADITALAEADAISLVEQDVMREGVAQAHSPRRSRLCRCAMRKACHAATIAVGGLRLSAIAMRGAVCRKAACRATA